MRQGIAGAERQKSHGWFHVSFRSRDFRIEKTVDQIGYAAVTGEEHDELGDAGVGGREEEGAREVLDGLWRGSLVDNVVVATYLVEVRLEEVIERGFSVTVA